MNDSDKRIERLIAIITPDNTVDRVVWLQSRSFFKQDERKLYGRMDDGSEICAEVVEGLSSWRFKMWRNDVEVGEHTSYQKVMREALAEAQKALLYPGK